MTKAPVADAPGSPKWKADRAIELLQRAVKAGWKDAAHRAKDKARDSLRDGADFKKLMESLQKASDHLGKIG